MRGARLAAPFVALTAVVGLAVGPLAQFAGANDPNVGTLQDEETTAPPEVDQPEASQPETAPPVADVPEQTDDTGDAPADDTTTPDENATTDAPAEEAPAIPALPADEDGVSADVENGAPNGGDGNGDGVADADQANVASLPSKYDVDGNGARDDYITIESPLFTSLANVRTLELPADNPPPDGVSIPAGLIDYDVHVITEGDAADVRLYLPDGTQSSVYMYQDGAWRNFDANSSIDDGANEVVLNLADGGAGDESGTNGVINDPVGVATPPAALGSFTVRNDNLPEPGVTFVYTVRECNTNAAPAAIGSCGPVLQTSPALADGATHTFTGLQTNNHWYRVQRAANASWTVSSISCSGGSASNNADLTNGTGAVRLNVGSATGGQCSFVNAQNGTVSVIKQTTPDGNATLFPVHLRRCGGGNNDSACSGAEDPFVTPNNVSIADNNHQTWTAANITTAGGFDAAPDGARFELTEDLPAGWTLQSVACVGGSGFSLKSQLTNGQRFFANSATPPIVCTLTNQAPQPGTITARKVGFRNVGTNTLEGYGQALESATFEYRVSGSADPWLPLCVTPASTNAGGTCVSGPINPGTYDVRELAAPTDWFNIPTASFPGGSSDVIPPAPYISTVTVPSGGNVNTRRMVNRYTNPGIPPVCGLDIALLIDRSGSIGVGDNEDAFEEAALSFISSLENTPTRVKIYSFAESASTNQGTFLDLNDPADVISANDTISDIYQNLLGGGTNWDAGFQQVLGAGAELVIIITDGNPTARNGDTGSTGTVNLEDVEFGVASANSVKNTGQKILAVGAGAAVSPTNLNLISSPADTYTGGLAELQEVLEGLAQDFCGGTVTINKQELQNGVYVPATTPGGWPFTANGAGLVNVVQNTNLASTTFEFPDGQSGPVTIDESVLAGWTLHQQGGFNAVCEEGGDPFPIVNNGLAGISFNLGVTDIIACTFRNDPIPTASVTIVKNAVPNDAQDFAYTATGAGVNNFSLDDDSGAVGENATLNNSITFNNLVPGTARTFTEGLVGGWDLTAPVTCTGGTGTPITNGISVTPTAGQSITCTFVNTKRASITIVKDAVPNDAQDFAYTATGAGVNNFSLDDDAGAAGENATLNNSITFNNLVPGTARTFTETLVGGWDLTAPVTCTGGTGSPITNGISVTPTAGQSITCTFVNTKRASITIVKDAVPNSAQDFAYTATGAGVNNFSLDDDAGAAGENATLNNSITFNNLVPGTARTFTEGLVGGWNLTAPVTCTGGTGSPITNGISVTPTAGQNITCTFVNTQQASITIVKDAVPNDAQDFAYTATGAGVNNFSLDDDSGAAGENATLNNSITFNNLVPGTARTFTEGLVGGWDLTAPVTCTGGTGTPITNGISVTPTAGQSITCTFVNTKRASITIVKNAVPNDAQDFAYTTTGAGVNNFSLDDDAGAAGENATLNNSITFNNLVPGTARTFTETTVPGWDLTAPVTCDVGGSPIADGISVTPTAGQSITCTFVNTKRASITIVKNAVPNDAQDFAYTATGAGVNNFSLDDDSGAVGENATLNNSITFNNLVPGTARTFTETTVPGWDLTAPVTCTGGTGSPIADGISVTPTAGQSITCTFTNTKRAKIITKKVTDPASDVTTEFEFDPSWGPDFDLVGGGQNDSGFLTPGNYSVAENTPPAGWVLSSAVCSDQSDPSNITLSPGEEVTCTFTNTRRAKIIVTKQTNPDGDPQEFQFNATYGGFTLSDGESDDSGFLEPGDGYSVSETVPAGWQLESATCDDGSEPDSITLSAGETVNCTFTNEKDASIVVVKQTNPDGSAQEFTFDPTWGPNFDLSDGESNDSGDLNPGNYSVSETVPAGWDQGAVTCLSSNGDNETAADISLQAGETVTCTFTNIQRGRIIVAKETTPDGDTTDFTFTPSWGAPFQLSDGETNNSGLLPPGSNYSVSETVPDGWTLDGATCSDGSPVNAIVLGPNETVTCTFNNSLNTATVTVIKNIGESDEAVAGWDINASVPGAGSGRFTEIAPNENPIVAPNGETATGVTTGEGDPPALLFTLDHVSNLGTTVTLEEILQEQFSFGGFSCTGGGVVNTVGRGGTVVVSDGQNVTCTLVNNPAGIGLTKDADPSQLEVGDQTTFTLTATNTADVPLTNIIFTDPLDPRFVFVSSPDDHLPAGPDCTAVGQDVTCGPFAGPLAPTEQFVVEFTVQVVAPAAVGDVIPNEAHVSALPPDGPEVVADAPIDVNIIEVLATATISVRKVTTGSNPAAPGPFPVTVRSGSAPFDETAQLATGGSSETFIVPEGDGYGVTEAVPAGWTLASIECVRVGGSNVDPAGFSAPGGSVTECVVTNDPGEVGGITVLPFTGSAGEMLLKTALWLLAIGGLALIGRRFWRRRELTA